MCSAVASLRPDKLDVFVLLVGSEEPARARRLLCSVFRCPKWEK